MPIAGVPLRCAAACCYDIDATLMRYASLLPPPRVYADDSLIDNITL